MRKCTLLMMLLIGFNACKKTDTEIDRTAILIGRYYVVSKVSRGGISNNPSDYKITVNKISENTVSLTITFKETPIVTNKSITLITDLNNWYVPNNTLANGTDARWSTFVTNYQTPPLNEFRYWGTDDFSNQFGITAYFNAK